MLVVFAPLFVLWMGLIYADLFRRYYEIRPVSLIPGSGFRAAQDRNMSKELRSEAVTRFGKQ
jgi:hypothetical protein